MGRNAKTTVEYFPHFVGSGKKMYFIENKYGNDGYATWYKLLEKIAETDYHYLDLNKDEEWLFLSSKCKVSEHRLLEIINDLTRVGAFDKQLWENKILWSKKFIDEIEEAYKRRNNKCMQYDDLCKHLIDLCILKNDFCKHSVCKNPQSRVDKSRVELSKDNIVGLPPATPTKDISFSEKCSQFIKKFNEIRGTKYQDTEKVKTKLKARLKKYTGSNIIAALKVAIKDQMHIEQNFVYLTPEYILREEILERYLNGTPVVTKQKSVNNQVYGEVGN